MTVRSWLWQRGRGRETWTDERGVKMPAPDYVFWDVREIDDSKNEEVELATYSKVIVRMGSQPKRVTLVDESDTEVAQYEAMLDDEDDESFVSTSIGYQGVEIMNVVGSDGREGVTLELRPHGI